MRNSLRHLLALLLLLTVAAPVANAAAPNAERAAVRALLAKHRAALLARLHAYAVAGQFPHDASVSPALHMFRDDAGRYCAVANLVHQDGRDDLVDEVVVMYNDLAVADVHGGGLYDWMLASGFTQEELVRIQLPAPYIGDQPARPDQNLKPRPITEAEMNAAVRTHLAAVEMELRRDADKSLDLATDRYLAAQSSSSS
jgi:hypothetical protein